MANAIESKCPSCGKTLTDSEYNDALEGFRNRVKNECLALFGKYKRGFEDQLLEQEKKQRAEIQYLKKIHSGQVVLIQQQKAEQEKQTEDLRKRCNELTVQTEKIQRTLTFHKRELKQRDKQLQLIQQQESHSKAELIEAGRTAVKDGLEGDQ
jgi:deoxycytidylate deaminase